MKHLNNRQPLTFKSYLCLCLIITLCLALALPTFAAAEGTSPIASINKLSELVFAVIRAVGMITLGLGALQLGQSFKSHDASQRMTAIVSIAGGLLITFAKEIIDFIV